VTVSELGERRLLARIRARLGVTDRGSQRNARVRVPDLPTAGLVIGIGDDAAVISPNRNAQTVLTTDAQIEGVHFERRFSPARDIGYRALAVNLSDLAAMGARPRWALLSLALPDTLLVDEVEGIVDGLSELAEKHRVVVVGGNVSRSPGPLMIDVTAVGEVRPRRVLTRAGATAGDELFVSGTIGGAAAGLEMLKKAVEGPGVSPACTARYLRPQPRVRLGMAVAQARAARAAIDLSDGLGDAVHQVADASGCGVDVDASALPIETSARTWWEAEGRDPVTAALTGGDDYELLVAVPRAWAARLKHVQSRVTNPPLTKIGVFTKDPSARVLVRNGTRETLPGGFEYWRT